MKKQLISIVSLVFIVTGITLNASSYYGGTNGNDSQSQGSTSMRGYYDTTSQSMGSDDTTGQYGNSMMSDYDTSSSDMGYSASQGYSATQGNKRNQSYRGTRQ